MYPNTGELVIWLYIVKTGKAKFTFEFKINKIS